ncbi:trypsin-like peptidase domain-containing protein [Streptomyces sp. NRRL S-920]|uniref:trypsin-like peptidase domain-containing protein n=1 Tax=Streptomyces sp. NRRL S-920 TaxID=1463921 RepID=UPI0004CC38B9|nr:trypsin-like peptidase domain-containing protein [Streptomyces sp. NRRL S-920]
MSTPGLDVRRVAEIIVTSGHGERRRGTGCLIRDGLVLTAEHVVRGARTVDVRFDADRPGERTHRAALAWSHADTDAALLTVAGEKADGPLLLGGIGERDAVLRCTTLGFPRHKLRTDPTGAALAYRDSCHAQGSTAVLGNRREGTLDLRVPPPDRDPDPDRSPWEGMSGAPVFSGERLVGIVARHHRSDGLGSLAVLRVDRWHERLDAAEQAALEALIGVRVGPGGDLRDVLPLDGGALAQSAHVRQVRDIAPPRLVAREAEIEELVTFCAGRDEPYQWWQALPWSGKTALASTFVLHPPAGVRTVSFFVTARWAEQADSDAFTDALIAQLAPLAGIAGAEAVPAGRDPLRRLLLERAAERLAERDETLLLVVDGLDEDRGAGPGSPRPSIAALLPPRPPANVRVLVTSRPHPGVPLDVPGDHPLRHCPRRRLDANDFARHTWEEAKRELHEALRGDRAQVDLLGLVTAAQGGLTLRDLVELTGLMPYELEARLSSMFGRSLETRTRWDLEEEKGYLFAHETLHEQAAEALGPALAGYRARIHAWADEYRERGWPDGTPGYLLHTYGRLLASGDDLVRHLATITDPLRHERLLAVTGSDAVARADVQAARRRLAATPGGDLGTVGELALLNDRLGHRGGVLPEYLPAVWAALGRRAQAEGMARSLIDPQARQRALARMVAHAAVPDPRLARSVAAETESLALRRVGGAEVYAYEHVGFCVDRVTGLIRAGEPHAALAEALRPPDGWERALVLRTLAERARAGTLMGVTELADVAEGSAERLRARPDRARPDRALLLGCAALAVREESPARSERLLRAAEQVPYRRARHSLACLAVLLARAEPERARGIVRRVRLRTPLGADVQPALAHVRQATGEETGGIFALGAAAEEGAEVALPLFSAEMRGILGQTLALAGRTAEARQAASALNATQAAEVEAAIALSLAATAPEEAAALARALAERSRGSDSDHAALLPLFPVLPEALALAGDADLAGRLSRYHLPAQSRWLMILLWRAEGGAEVRRMMRRAGLGLSPGAFTRFCDYLDVLARAKGVDDAAVLAGKREGAEAASCFASLIRQLPPGDPRRARYAERARAEANDGDPRPEVSSSAWWAGLAATLWGQPDAVRFWIAARVRSVAGTSTGAQALMPRASATRWLGSPFERASAVLALAATDPDEAVGLLKRWRRRDACSESPEHAEAGALWAMTEFLLGIPEAERECVVPERSTGPFLAAAALALLGGGREWHSLGGSVAAGPSLLRRLLVLDSYTDRPRAVDSAGAERLIRELLVREDWWRALPALALLDPAAVRRIGAAVLRRLS